MSKQTRQTISTPSQSQLFRDFVTEIPTLDECPNCLADLKPYQQAGVEELSFCLKCKFPLMLIANKYRLSSILGEGGFSVVYKAEHIAMKRSPERVIKVIKPELLPTRQAQAASEQGVKMTPEHIKRQVQVLRKRFRREVQLTAAISQRNQHVVRIYDDFGEIPNLGCFYVMEYLEGEPLSRYIRRPSQLPPIEWCLELFKQLCDAMEAAHDENIIHRDLKPDNLLLVRHPKYPLFLKVIDFGIAKPLNGQATPADQQTRGALGSPYYMSPEQCTKRSPDSRSDIYAMGVILFQLLTGYHPFVMPSQAEDMSIMEMLYAHLTKIPPSLIELRPDRGIPEAAEKVVFRALAKKPESRFQTVGEFWEALSSAFHLQSTIELTGTQEVITPLDSPVIRMDIEEELPVGGRRSPKNGKSNGEEDKTYFLEDDDKKSRKRKTTLKSKKRKTSSEDADSSLENDYVLVMDIFSKRKGIAFIVSFAFVLAGIFFLPYLYKRMKDGEEKKNKVLRAKPVKPKPREQEDPLKKVSKFVDSKESGVRLVPPKPHVDKRRTPPVARKGKKPTRIRKSRGRTIQRKVKATTPCPDNSWKMVKVSPKIRRLGDISTGRDKPRVVSGGFCVTKRTRRVAIDQKGYAPCSFTVPKNKRTLRVCLLTSEKAENLGVLPDDHCLKTKWCKR